MEVNRNFSSLSLSFHFARSRRVSKLFFPYRTAKETRYTKRIKYYRLPEEDEGSPRDRTLARNRAGPIVDRARRTRAKIAFRRVSNNPICVYVTQLQIRFVFYRPKRYRFSFCISYGFVGIKARKIYVFFFFFVSIS